MLAVEKATEFSCAAYAVSDPELQLAYRTLARLWTNLAKEQNLLTGPEQRSEEQRLLEIEALTLTPAIH